MRRVKPKKTKMNYEEYLKQNPEFAARQKAKEEPKRAHESESSRKDNNHNIQASPPITAICLYVFGCILYIIVALTTSIFAGSFVKATSNRPDEILLAVIIACAVSIFPSLLLFALGDIVKYLKIISEK